MKKFIIGFIALVALVLIVTMFLKISNKTAPSTPLPTNSEALQNKNNSENVKTQSVNYYSSVNGFYAEPRAEGDFPGVIMIHEWWGLNEQIKDMAKTLASNGYRVLAVDLYNGQVTSDPGKATALVSSLNQSDANANMEAAKKFLEDKGSTKIASLGWCFGGGQSLQLALSGEKLNATILYYGTPLVTDSNKLSNIKWPVLGIFGDADQAIPVNSVKEFEKNLNSLGIKNEIHIYPGVGHAFANPTGPNYAPGPTKDSWDKTLSFLKENLK